MISASLFPHEIVVVTPAVVEDRYHAQTLTYDIPPATQRTIRAFMQPSATQEDMVDRNALTYAYTVYTTEALEARDRVTFDGHTYEVDGPPRRWDAFMGAHHYEALLRVTEG